MPRSFRQSKHRAETMALRSPSHMRKNSIGRPAIRSRRSLRAEEVNMKIAIIGAGNVGAALAGGWSKKGHQIMLGVRQPGKPEIQELVKSLANVSAMDIAAAAMAGEVVVLATPWPATKAAIEACGNLAGKTVIDCTNPVKPDL